MPKPASAIIVALVITLLALASRTPATTAIIPSDEELIVGARVILKGKVLSITGAIGDDGRVYSYITVKVKQVYKGEVTSPTVVLKELGGHVGDTGLTVYGNARFTVGEKTLLYLDTWRDGSLRVYQMFLGKFDIYRDAVTQETIVERGAPDENTRIVQQHRDAGSARGVSTERMELKAYARMIKKTLKANESGSAEFERTYYEGIPVLAEPPEYDRFEASGQLQPQFTFIFSPPPRWFEPDEGLPVVFHVKPDLAPTPNVMQDMDAALGAWSTLAGSALRLANGGPITGCYPGTQLNAIVFDNCDGRNAPTPGCASILAWGGVSWNRSITKVVNGVTFVKAREGFVSFNPYASCNFPTPCEVREVGTHEIGHAIGFGHSQFSDATMSGFAHFDGRCASLRQDDVNAALFVYPSAGGGGGPLSIATPSPLKTAFSGIPYSLALTGAGGTLPYVWTLEEGSSLPPGFSLSPGGLLGGTPDAPGIHSFTIRLADGASAQASKLFSLTVVDGSQAYSSAFVSQSVPQNVKPRQSFTVSLKWQNMGTQTWNGTAGFKLASQNPPGNVTWGGNIVNLPGQSVPSGEQLSVTFTASAPATNGLYNFQWQLFQEGVGLFGQMSSNLQILVGDPPPTIATSVLPDAIRGLAYGHQISASGGKPPYQWSITGGALPPGLTLEAGTGIIGGVPLVSGGFVFGISVTDSLSLTSSKLLTMIILDPPLAFDLPPVIEGLTGEAFNYLLAGSGGTPPYTWSISAGQLPPGLSLDSASGVISGTSSVAGTFPLTVTLRDQADQSVARPLDIKLIDPATIPFIKKVKYKDAKKLVVNAQRAQAAAKLLVDGVEVTWKFNSVGKLVAKNLTLTAGRHEIKVVNPDNISSQPYFLDVP